ncbi:bifunctional glutamate N-acetyltransferase/amino-acid acetyltransferase ArgJ [Candidatus Frankia alpina]|uniref:bifunctional glutamate N-acetyltransferase/amino-acid acetyltransferase ArgJ n=1 Tax=Candidatus Frankia alpina TaxID=2699483 RepID=UPI0013D723E1|nr:bifunctional glutamate N-acetyltransferase/amino-acid acetyltransferase ArgJ [Candidatus Frankia alpina]
MSVTAPKGFRAAGVAAGLKPSGRPDVALVVNDGPSDAAAGVFTRNRIQAAPVLWTRQTLADGRLRAVVLNSGGANACTGPAGFADTHTTAEHVAAGLGLGAGDVAVCSTGLIGVRLPMDNLLAGVTKAVAVVADTGGDDAAEAIRTTDTVAKTAVRISTATSGVTVGAMGKGAAMLAPSLATMLVVVTTDAVADAATLDRVVREASRVSFERVDSDGCLSTNDTVLLLASGACGVTLPEAELTGLVAEVCTDLAQQMLGDAEGSTKTIAITVTGAASEADALEVGRSVARNNLLKCALYGKDPNWGRVLAAVGTTQAAFEPDQLDVSMNGVQVCRAGAPGEDRDLVDLSDRRIDILVDLHAGAEELTIWTNDLTDGYVYENSAYST